MCRTHSGNELKGWLPLKPKKRRASRPAVFANTQAHNLDAIRQLARTVRWNERLEKVPPEETLQRFRDNGAPEDLLVKVATEVARLGPISSAELERADQRTINALMKALSTLE